MNLLLALSALIDRLTDRFGVLAKWGIVLSCFISAGNAVVRHSLDYSSNGWLEIQWYLLAACVMLGAPKVLRLNEHVRVDLFYGRRSARTRSWIDLFGLAFFLLPTVLVLLYFSWPLAWTMYRSGEMSSNAGGLIRWPAMAMLPLGALLLALQGLSEAVKRVATLRGLPGHDLHYARPDQ